MRGMNSRINKLEKTANPEGNKPYVIWEELDDPNLFTGYYDGQHRTMTRDEWNSLRKGEDVIIVTYKRLPYASD